MEPTPVYDPDEAAVVTYHHLPAAFKSELRLTDVALILELEFAYQQAIGLVSQEPPAIPEPPASVDQATLVRLIQERAAASGATFGDEAITAVLSAEEIYLRQIGAIDP